MDFKSVLALVTSFLGIDALAKKNGKSVLTDDQRARLVEEYGEKFVSKFEKDLADYEKDGTDNFAARVDAKIAELVAKNQELEAKVEKLSSLPEPEPPFEVKKTDDGKKVIKMGAKMRNYHHNRVAREYLSGNTGVLAAGDTIDVSDVINEFGDLVNYYKPEVLTDIMTGFESAKYMTVKRGIKSWKASHAELTSVVQQFVPKWTPSGKTKFTPIEIPLYRMKINMPILPADVEDWIFQMYDESVDIDQHPVTKYILNNLLKPRALEDIELKMIATGEFEALDPSTVNEGDPGQPPEKAMNGFMTILKNKKASGSSNINFVDLGTITDSNIVDKINEFVDAIDEKYQSKNMPIIMSNAMKRRYKRAYKKLYGSDSGDPNFGQDIVDYSNNRLVALPSMAGQDGFFATPKSNFILLRHKNEPGASKIYVRKHDYELHVIGEFHLGVGFAIEEAVWAYIPSTGSGSGSGV